MAGWAGFSEDELRKIQQKDQAVPAAALGRGRKAAPTNRSRLQRERALQSAAPHNTGTALPVLSPGQQLAKPPPPPPQPPQPAVPVLPAAKDDAEAVVASKPLVEKMNVEPVNHVSAAKDDSPPVELEKQEVELREKTRIEQLQHEQKTMEEKNKRKKALITKTIAEKSKQTQAEAVKLKRIQKELQALDDMVSNDIGILRGRIEQASWDYSIARKRYEKAEAEYVVAKLDLHKKTEIKEQLTEHLCAIIQQNELRKANKLEELMQQLQVHASEEEEEEVVVVASPKEDEEKNGKGVQKNGETLVCSTPEHGSTLEGQTAKEGVADSTIHQDRPPVTEPHSGDQNCKMLDNSPLEQNESEASASAS